MLDQIERLAAPVALFAACHRRDQRGIMDLLLEGYRVDTPNPHGQTMLMIASRTGDQPMVELLLSQGADVKARDAFGRICLHYAVGSGDSQLVRYLVSAGAEIESSTQKGHTPLHYACRSTELAVMQTLVELGADVHALTLANESMLHQAIHSIEHGGCMQRMPAVVEFLTAIGVDRMICSSGGKIVVDLIEHWLQVFADDKQRVIVLQAVRPMLLATVSERIGN